MALSAATLGSLIDTNLQGEGANGSNRTVFANAVAAGIVMSIVGKAFATADVGLVPGIGVGSGTGVIGLSAPTMTTTAVNALPSTGVNAEPMMRAIMMATVTHLADATLTSSHTPVFLGSGTIVIGSIPVMISEMSSNIDVQLLSAGANGSNRTILSTAIATGIVNEIIAAGTGTVTIAGTFTGSVPPGPVPGAGAGTGVIT